MIANLRRPGTTSRKSSSRLRAVSVCCCDRPVMLPPGRARLTTRPVPIGSPDAAVTIGMTDVACLAVDLEPDEFGGDLGEALFGTFRPAVLDCDGAALDPAKLTQPLQKSGYPLSLGRTCARAQEPNRLRRLLRARGEWPCHRRAAEDRDELAPLHCQCSCASVKRIAQHYCAAGFQFGLCRLRVISSL
jgi:hypothetical protein